MKIPDLVLISYLWLILHGACKGYTMHTTCPVLNDHLEHLHIVHLCKLYTTLKLIFLPLCNGGEKLI